MFNIDNLDYENDSQFIVGFDYDGVITKRGSSGENEEKWLKREKNILWRKFLNMVSRIYNCFFPLNKEIIELTEQLKALKCKILVISSHTLTTTNYKESKQTRKRIENRLKRENIIYDDIYFVLGDKVEICQKLGVHLMVEDNVEKVKALRSANIPTIAKRTKKNIHLLENDPDAVNDLLEILSFVLKSMQNKKLLDNATKAINNSNKNLAKNHKNKLEQNSNPIFASFSEKLEEDNFFDNELLESVLGLPIQKKLVPQNDYKN